MRFTKPEKPCIEWYAMRDELAEGEYNNALNKETTEKCCKNCSWFTSCFSNIVRINGNRGIDVSREIRTPTPSELRTRSINKRAWCDNTNYAVKWTD